jgi:hypothetical protein
MLMTLFAVGLSAPSLPLLPVFTCACEAKLEESARTIAARVQKEEKVVFMIENRRD